MAYALSNGVVRSRSSNGFLRLRRVQDERSAKERYDTLVHTRAEFVEEGYRCSQLTIPSLFPREGSNRNAYSNKRFPTPFQAIGAMGTNTLSSKLMLSLFPPNVRFFELSVLEADIEKMLRDAAMDGVNLAPIIGNKTPAQLTNEMNQRLKRFEPKVVQEIEEMGMRAPLYEMLRHLIVVGNAIFYIPDKGPARMYSLDRFVVQRDCMGNLLCVVICETIAESALDRSAREALMRSPTYKRGLGASTYSFNADGSTYQEAEWDLYTVIERRQEVDDDPSTATFDTWQEIEDQYIDGSHKAYDERELPWIVLRYTHVSGWAYGRSRISELYGDLASLEVGRMILSEAGAMLGKMLVLVDPRATVTPQQVKRAPNGEVLSGEAELIKFLQCEKSPDLTFLAGLVERLEVSLRKQFFMFEARPSERTTAEEVRLEAQETDAGNGGIYSILTIPQRQMLVRVMHRINKRGEFPTVDQQEADLGYITPRVITGLEAIGRGQELSRLNAVADFILKLFGPEAAARYLEPIETIGRAFLGAGVDSNGILKDRAAVAREIQAEQRAAMAQQIAPEAVRQVGGMIDKQIPETTSNAA